MSLTSKLRTVVEVCYDLTAFDGMRFEVKADKFGSETGNLFIDSEGFGSVQG